MTLLENVVDLLVIVAFGVFILWLAATIMYFILWLLDWDEICLTCFHPRWRHGLLRGRCSWESSARRVACTCLRFRRPRFRR